VSENKLTDVPAAFEILLEEIEAEIEFINQMGCKAFECRDYKSVQAITERAQEFSAFRDKIASLRKEYATLAARYEMTEEEERVSASRRALSRLPRGLRTPQEAYYRPILQALINLGGSVKMNEVLALVEQMMKDTLKDVDYEPLASNPEMPRWRNAAQWARQALVEEGFLKADSPRGVWEISESGRKKLSGED